MAEDPDPGPRQPIVAVLGHVDHGKTSILDHFRSLGEQRRSSVMAREAGGITQHIGATEITAQLLNETCGELLGGKEFASPGLLFIDTPGHHSFTSLRSRGGALADIAILVVDIMEGCKPQTLESIRILKQHKTPFVLALNKVDRVHHWSSERGRSMAVAFEDQTTDAQAAFEKLYWKLVGELSEQGFNMDLYSRVTDFTDTIAAVPCSAKEGEGLQDLLAVTVGLAERFLADRLHDFGGEGEGTILELKDEQGLGKTADLILYRGQLAKGDHILLVSQEGPFWSHVKGMFRPRGMTEMRDAGDRWDDVDLVEAAAGVKVGGPDFERVLVGTTLRVFPEQQTEMLQRISKLTADAARATADGKVDRAAEMKSQRSQILSELEPEALERFKAAKAEASISVELSEEGVIIKADTLGGLEALAFELDKLEVPIRSASIGEIKKRDIRAAEASHDALERIILAFNTELSREAAEAVEEHGEVEVISAEVIYHIIERFEQWRIDKEREIAEAKRGDIVHPGRIKLLEDHVFRRNNPAVVGIRVLGGRVRTGQSLLRLDGTRIGRIRSIRSGEETLKEVHQGAEVAIAIPGVTVGRQIDEGDILLVDIPSAHAARLRESELSTLEEEILEELTQIHREDDHFWGR